MITPVNNVSDYSSLRKRLSNSLGPLVGVAISNVSGDLRCLYPEEAQAAKNAVPRRQREFAAGRKAARSAMQSIGWREESIPCNADRSPSWPEGLVGSISHCKRACMAIVSRKVHLQSIGIDIEDQCPIEAELWPSICTPQELEFVNQFQTSERGLWVTRIFSAKEAFYKWQYPTTMLVLGFQEVAITFEESTQTFSANSIEGKPIHSAFGHAWGHSFIHQKLVVSIIA